nr:MAG TPA: hypothetical protein [Caudoviricetes sp.]
MVLYKYIKEIENTSNEIKKYFKKCLTKYIKRVYNKNIVKGYNHTVQKRYGVRNTN